MIRPAIQREVTIDLPRILVESLGDGADMLAHHLTRLAENGAQTQKQQPPPMPVLCRICERQITCWWFPKHTELCMQEHQAEAALHQVQDNLTEHRNAIVKVLDALEAQTRHKSLVAPDISSPPLPAEYKGMAIGSESLNSSAVVSPGTSPAPLELRSSGLSHHRARSFVVRRPLSRIVELVLDLCDTALEISQPSLKDTKGSDDEELRTQSPQSEGRISQVLHWQSPSAGALEHEDGLAALCEDTSALAKAKVDSTMRFRAILEYSERIRTEFTGLVQESIDAALEKAARIAAGESSGDESIGKAEVEEEENEGEVNSDEQAELAETASDPEIPSAAAKSDPEATAAQFGSVDRHMSSSFDGLSSMSMALRSAATRSPSPSSSPTRRISSTLSTRSSSPKSCPTPKSGAPSTNTAPHPKTANLSAVESDAGGDSDGSARSSIRSLSRSGQFSSNELGLPGVATSRERKRTSLILPREQSKTRQESPARGPMPALSPLRVNKPRLASGSLDNAKSPIVSPTMASSEFASPTILPQEPHHRRQSSAASSDISRAGMSPRLTFANAPQPRALAPSIRDFEIIKPISKGAFGSVYLAKKKSTGDYYAIKAMKKQDMVAKNQVANVKAERAILMFQGESDFVAKLYWTFPSKDYIFLVMEYLNGGDCSSLVQALGSLPEDWAKKYLAEVVLGIEHLHGREIVHRDLKPDNLLIDQKGHLKLTDFGLSRMGLIGRQKRALNSKNTGAAPDPLKQGPFQRSVSMTSSRSASFDTQGNIPSPSQTPYMMPVFAGDGGQPSYFSLGRESSSGSREPTRQSSMNQSDNGDADALSTAFRRFSIYDDPLWSSTRGSPKEDEVKEPHEPADGYGLQQTSSNSSHQRNSTPPQAGGAMGPPPMALFDPQDSSRRFVGTPDYLAPETINGLGQDEMSDWWSLGCIMFEFLYGYPPFHAATPDQVFDNILNRKIDWPAEEDESDVSADARDLMNKLMCLDPSQRLGANLGEKFTSGGEEVRKHPWFADIDWNTLNEAEASFVPAPENIEDTEYFDSRGATAEDFATEFDDQATSHSTTPVGDFERPHDALSKVRTQVNSMKRGLMPLHIPPHVRDGRSRRLSEPVAGDDFGQFSFKNLNVLEKANKDVIQKLRAEAMQAQSRSSQIPPNPSGNNNSPPSLESSPVIGAPLKRALSTNNRGNHRSASPSTISHTNSSPSRISQPSSPLVQFSTGERRKASSGASSMAQIGTSLQPGNFFDVPRLSTSMKTTSNSSSPIKTTKSPSNNLEGIPPNFGSTSPRARSHTVGANEIDSVKDRIAHHHKRRSQVIEVSPSSSDTEDPRQKALLRVQRRRQSSRRMLQITLSEGPIFRPLDILIVEDHPVSRLVMEKLVEKLRCRAIIVNDGAEAMRYAMSSVKFDIIMMEYKLPQINGADVARMLRETKNANCHTPIVAVTGYLKELTAPHHFDALVEKPPTQAKLTEVMSRLCQWKPPPPGWASSSQTAAQQVPMPPSGLRKQSLAHDDSPTSTGSGYPSLPSLSHRASSREDSMSTVSVWTDPDGPADDLSSKHPEMDWRDGSLGGLGISDTRNLGALAMEAQSNQSNLIPILKTHDSAPPDLAPEELQMPRRVPSAEKIEAKKRSWITKEQIDTGESGDDEDEELGVMRITSRSPRVKPYGHHSRTSSKLGIEMMRTNSQGTVVDSTGDTSGTLSLLTLEDNGALSPSLEPIDTTQTSEQEASSKPALFDIGGAAQASLTPPEIFMRPSGHSKDINMDANTGMGTSTDTPPPPPNSNLVLTPDPDPTPKASNSPRHED